MSSPFGPGGSDPQGSPQQKANVAATLTAWETFRSFWHTGMPRYRNGQIAAWNTVPGKYDLGDLL